ncbi:hypothetical protein COCOR_07350 [Corallococcus coralloides DSM 2259]|uniref:Uncharacterized protein n=1 Tax=Corallococcus coralloides (strain ATCC 25202 / DSM 2259 / NBRC 100086 / M2) TaxID=1144275 RepID=H8MLB7_CORCM|nr:hypothetical protein [Corallococcus coralloides]AFE07486.1 hypothetical protein COCOR_07350 [Corallococcus coralloides DSM 2259]
MSPAPEPGSPGEPGPARPRNTAVRTGIAVTVFAAVVATALFIVRLSAMKGSGAVSPEQVATEARVQVLALCDAVQGFRDEHGDYVSIAPAPAPVPQRGEAVPFPKDHEDFRRIGFDPGPAVHLQYEVRVEESPVGEPEVSCFARADTDGDGLNAVYRVRLDANGMTTPVEVEHEGE